MLPQARRRSRSVGPSLALLAILLAVAHGLAVSPQALVAYLEGTGQPATVVATSPQLMWSHELAWPTAARLRALSLGSDQALVVYEAAGLHARWLDPLGYTIAERSWPETAGPWLAVGGDLWLVASSAEQHRTVQIESANGSTEVPAGVVGPAAGGMELFALDGATVIVAAYGGVDFSAPADPAAAGDGALSDRLSVYRRDAVGGDWQLTQQLVYADRAVVQIAALPGDTAGSVLPAATALAVLLFDPTAVREGNDPFELVTVDLEGRQRWQQPVALPAWRLGFVTEDGAGVWAWRNAELARFDDRRIRHLGSGDGSIERCWPADVSGRAAACVVARPGGSLALTRWDDQGGRGPFITLAGARWWPLWGAGLLVGRERQLALVDARGHQRWSLQLPFAPTHAAYGNGRLLVSDGIALALLAWPQQSPGR